MLVKNELVLNGLDAEVYLPVAADNEMTNVYPEYDFPVPEDSAPRQRIRVLVSNPVSGLLWDNQISYEDKLEEQYTVSMLYEFPVETRIKVFYPDNKWLFLRLIARKVDHPYSTIGHNYTAVVV